MLNTFYMRISSLPPLPLHCHSPTSSWSHRGRSWKYSPKKPQRNLNHWWWGVQENSSDAWIIRYLQERTTTTAGTLERSVEVRSAHTKRQTLAFIDSPNSALDVCYSPNWKSITRQNALLYCSRTDFVCTPENGKLLDTLCSQWFWITN